MTQVNPESRFMEKLHPDGTIDIDDKLTKTSEMSDAATMMSNHTMRLGCYEINLGTEQGQKLHTIHLVFLPLVPIMILLIQNYTTFDSNKVRRTGLIKEYTELRIFFQATINDLTDVFLQVQNSLDFAELTKKLQQERVSVALNFFIKGRESETKTFT